MTPERIEELTSEGRRHLEFCMRLYRLQLEQGLYFLHEHPAYARSWQETSVQELVRDYRVKTVHANMCMYGMTSTDSEGTAPVKKDTAFMTNAIKISEKLSKYWRNIRNLSKNL